MATLTQTRTCQIGVCSDRVPATLAQQGICLDHYLDQAFARVASALEQRRKGRTLDSRTMDWLQKQGDFTVQLLAEDGPAHTPEERSRLLDLLLCLANVQEYAHQGPATW
jgi:hypothetical protein